MPPARQPERVAQARNAEPYRQRDGIVLGGPDAALRHRHLKPEPVAPRGAVAAPIESRVIGQDLQAGPHDEQHEEHVQEVLELQPPGKARVDRGRRLRDAGMVLNESRHTRKLAQALRERDKAKQRRDADRQRPQRVDPAAPDANAGKNSLLRRHPVIETDAVVRIAETGTERLGRGRLDSR